MMTQSLVVRYYHLLYCMLFLVINSATGAQKTEFESIMDDTLFQYSVVQTGENYTFKFKKSPVDNIQKIKAGYHVLQSVYQDSSINPEYSERYIRERARCYMFDSHFYTYTLCMLPNEYSEKNKNRYWGFVTQLPNWKWLITRILLPVLLTFGFFFWVSRQKHSVN